MEHTEKKVIMASAGTGKTYRLSLEFISLLLKYKDDQEFDFSQIVVMTFTRKATAEIREKILDFLQELASDGSESAVIISNLEKISGYKWQSRDREYIKTKLLNEILQRKDLLQVSTIDSFTTNIFKSMIVPYLRIKDFNIDNNSNDEILPMLLDFIFSDQVFKIFEPLLKRLNLRTVEEIQGFIKSLIDNRWVLDYYDNGSMTGVFSSSMNLDSNMIEQFKAKNWKIFKDGYLALVEEYNTLVFETQNKAWPKHLMKEYKDMIDLDEMEELNLTEVFEHLLADPNHIIKNIKKFFDRAFPFAKSRKKDLQIITAQFEEEFAKTMVPLADFYLISEIIPQQQEVVSAWKTLCEYYDSLKFNLGKFTYNDVTFYTYKYLYEESLSLIDRRIGEVTNLFYEQLISRFRFLLIDEFQDTSFNQFNILIPIINELTSGNSIKDYTGVIIVGDPKQSIYGWRGGERGIMEIMPEKLKVSAEDLSQCFRSTRPVIDIVNRIFTDENFQQSSKESKREWYYSPVTAKNWSADDNCYLDEKDEGGELFYWEFNKELNKKKQADADSTDDSNEDEKLNSFEEFAKQIKSLHSEGKIEWGQTAILVRTKIHAGKVANELNKLNIPNNIESSGKLLEHKTVEILLAVLKFRLLKDRFSLLHFLRSDLVLLNSQDLTEILKLYHSQAYEIDKENEFAQLKKFPEVEKLLTLVNKEYLSHAQFIREVINNYEFSKICQNEIDWKNIYTFLELIINFELTNLNTSSFDLYGFMEYCQKQLETNSEILQEGLQLENSITILTVHASKGLGFKNVFLYWELANWTPPNKGKEFKLTYSFDKQTYLGLTDFVIYSSSDDEKVLRNSASDDLINEYDERGIIEAIDVFYVALTRAEQKLGLFFSYKSKSDFTDYIASLKKEAGVIGQLVTAYKEFFIEKDEDNLSRDGLVYYHYFKANLKLANSQANIEQVAKSPQENYLKKYLTDYSQPKLEENKPIENMKKVYLEDRHQLFGNAAHEFLTYIKYGKETAMAENMVYRKFGSLLSLYNIKNIFRACQEFIASNQDIFSPKWDKVFNEKTIFQDGKEYRIDRMMINTKRKEVIIIDYKTGGIHDKEQVNKYVEIIQEMPFVKANGYEVKGKFLEVIIDIEEVE